MRWLLPVSLGGAVALSALGGLLWQQRTAGAARTAPPAAAAKAASGPIDVDVFTADERPFEVKVRASGTLLPSESVELVSELSRRLVRVRAKEGALVEKGAVLFELDASDLRAELAKLEVEARLAKTTLDRQESLLKEGLTTGQEIDAARASYDHALAQQKAHRVTLDKTLIRAPFSGRVGLRRVSEGAWVSPTTVLTTLEDTSALKLDFTLPERYAGLLMPDSAFRFTIAGRGDAYSGKVLAQESSIDKQTRSIVVRGLVEPKAGLVPGSFANVEVPLRTERALMIPAIAVIPGVEGRRVFVVQGDIARSVPVELGERTAEHVQILSGVVPGDAVVVSNLLRMTDGAKVKPRPLRQP